MVPVLQILQVGETFWSEPASRLSRRRTHAAHHLLNGIRNILSCPTLATNRGSGLQSIRISGTGPELISGTATARICNFECAPGRGLIPLFRRYRHGMVLPARSI